MPRQARLDSQRTLHRVMNRGIELGDMASGEKDRKEILSRIGELAAEIKRKI